MKRVLYLWPGFMALLLAGLLGGCVKKTSGKNQGREVSPSGHYRAQVTAVDPTGRDGKTFHAVWKVLISDATGASVVYEDSASDISANFNVYWGWDGDTFWLYNSDDNRATKWTQEDKGWVKHPETAAKEMPAQLRPDYSKNR